MPTGPEIRLVLVEDVPQVAQYVRALVNAAPGLELLDVFEEGRRALDGVAQQRPDIVIVDALLQGRVGGLDVAHAIRRSGLPVSVIVITVPQHPVRPDAEHGIDAVLQMPFNGHELAMLLRTTNEARRTRTSGGGTFVVSVFAPKGGVGKTTIAFNLAVSLAQGTGRRTALVDGSLQYGDLRALLQVPGDAPSILDLPTDRIQESDVTKVVWRDPSGIDLLLAPPRIEQAEMVTRRDIEKALSFLRRAYDAIVVDTPTSLNEATIALLDGSDVILQVITYDRTTIRSTLAVAETFRAIGYPMDRVRYLLNRSDSSGGMDPAALASALGRPPEHTVVSDGRLVVESNNQGMPFVLASPEAKISVDIQRIATALATMPRVAGARA